MLGDQHGARRPVREGRRKAGTVFKGIGVDSVTRNLRQPVHRQGEGVRKGWVGRALVSLDNDYGLRVPLPLHQKVPLLDEGQESSENGVPVLPPQESRVGASAMPVQISKKTPSLEQKT